MEKKYQLEKNICWKGNKSMLVCNRVRIFKYLLEFKI